VTSTPASVLDSVSDRAWEAISGAYDLQVHVEPDLAPRRTDDLSLARDFLAHGLAGFVLKSHYAPTAERAKVVSAAVPGIEAFGAVCLNHGVGGLNPVAVDIAGRSGARIVWLPTVDSLNEWTGEHPEMAKPPVWMQIKRDMEARNLIRSPVDVFDADGNPAPALLECFAAVVEHHMVLATGHLSRSEINQVVPLAFAHGVNKVIITHPEFPSQNLSPSDQKALAEQGAFVEHCFTTPYTGKCTWETVFEGIAAAGVEQTIISTDLGQVANPPVAEGLAAFAQMLLDNGLDEGDVKAMAVGNPSKLMATD
jgi:hypothetical protein